MWDDVYLYCGVSGAGLVTVFGGRPPLVEASSSLIFQSLLLGGLHLRREVARSIR